jgi:hypothetical protein
MALIEPGREERPRSSRHSLSGEHWAFSSIYSEGECSKGIVMDTATYAAIAVLPWNVLQRMAHIVVSEAEFVPLNLSYISKSRIHLYQATGPCNDL